MTKAEKERYEDPELLGEILKRVLVGKKFRLHCGTSRDLWDESGKRCHDIQRQEIQNYLQPVRD